jgi:cathepsin F
VFAVVIVLLGAVSVCAGPPKWVQSGDEPVLHRFSRYITDFGKKYENEQEKIKRFLFFKDNMAKAAKLNELHNGTAEFGPTIFSDLSVDEFTSQFLSGVVNPPDLSQVNVTTLPLLGYAPKLDWVSLGKVTAVKNQGQCGSCWAFTAVGEMESQLLMKGRGVFSLSPQQLVDCDPFDTGCNGGFYDRAWKYISQTGGVENERDYPYQDGKFSCRFNSGKVAARVASASAISCGTSAGQIYDFVSTHGPSAAALDATPLQNYRGGVLNMAASYCSSLNHAVLVVGYDTTVNPASLKVRNSWGASWGESGYFRITPTSCLINLHIMGSSVA